MEAPNSGPTAEEAYHVAVPATETAAPGEVHYNPVHGVADLQVGDGADLQSVSSA